MRIKIKLLKKPLAGTPSLIGQPVTVKGWVRTVRKQKKFCFLEINDGSTLSNLQVVLDESAVNYEQLTNQLTTGTAVEASGKLVESPGSGQDVELQAKQILIIGTCPAEDYPMQKKRHTFEYLRSIAHLRPRTNTFGAISRVRNAMAFATHQFFQQLGFLYLQTPIITASDCEGAGEMFCVTTLDLEKPPKTEEGKIDFSKDFFAQQAFLTVSGQLEGEVYATALSDVYTFGPTFRAENSNTARHLAEFWMIEPEMAFADLNDDMDNAEAYLKYVLKYVLENCPEDMQFFDQFISNGLLERLNAVVNTPFERTSYTYAVRVLEKSGQKFEYPISWGVDLQTEHERYLTEKFFNKPVIINDYPRDIKAFYMRDNDDHKTVAAMDILMPTVGEIVGGSQREERLDVLKKKLKANGLSEEHYWWYLELRKYGSVPHAGYGVGFERLLRFATGMDNIRDVIAFHRTPGNIDF